MKEEGKTDDGFGPLGICQRLFNFIINSFLTRRIMPPREDGSRSREDGKPEYDLIKHNDHDTGTEILVEFRHTNGAMGNQRINGSDQILVKDNGNAKLTRRKTDSQDQSNGNGGREKDPKRSTLTIIEGGDLPGRKHHLLNVTSNINEKAESFIRSRKEAMEKNLR